MATTFLEPGGDADFVNPTTTNGFWTTVIVTPSVVSDFVHGRHQRSIKYRANFNDSVRRAGILTDAGSRVSFYIYIVTLPSATTNIIWMADDAVTNGVEIRLSSSGRLVLARFDTDAQIGATGIATLITSRWYRISIAYTITSNTVNRFEVFVDGVSDISVTDATIATGAVNTSTISIGNSNDDGFLDFRSSDHYVDNSSSLTDTGDIWVTAKRSVSNGTTNGFTTQVGASGSGYGSGHSPQVNERALSTTNGWSMVGAGSAVTEEYNIETKSKGDIGIVGSIVDYVGWVSTKALVGETINIILNGVNFSQAITSTITLYTKVAGSTSYPSGSGADIGITTDTSLTTVSLYECGVIVAFIPTSVQGTVGNYGRHVTVGAGGSRNERAT